MNTLLTFSDVKIEPEKNEAFYSLMKNDFEDKEFSKYCEDICKNEMLYGKYPAPKLFYDRREKDENTILVEVGTFYVDSLTTPEYAEALEGLTFDEKCKIEDAVWDWVYKNKQGELVSKRFIADRLRQFRPQPKEDFITLSEIKTLLENHKKE